MAKAIADSTGGVTISIDKVHYAVMTEDSKSKETPPQYGDIKPLPNAKNISGTPNDSIQSENYDGAPKVTAVAKGEIKVSFTKSDFSDEDISIILGRELVDGAVVQGADDVAPYIAIGFRLETTQGHKYYWYLKGMMASPAVSGATKEQGNLTFQNQTIEGTFIYRDYDGKAEVFRHYKGDADTEEACDKWFSMETLIKYWRKTDAAA